MIAEVVVVCKYTHFLVKAVVIIHFFCFPVVYLSVFSIAEIAFSCFAMIANYHKKRLYEPLFRRTFASEKEIVKKVKSNI